MSVPISSDDDLLVQVAWLYYVGGRSQEEIAQRVGLSRFKITRLLAGARDRGLVKISIDHHSTEALAQADQIAGLFGLRECIVTPALGLGSVDPVADDDARRAVGIAAARYLARRVQAPGPITVGVGWGRTLAALAAAVSGVNKPDARFVSLMGSLTRSARTNQFEVVHTLAQACGGESYLLPAPFLADSEQDFRVIMSQKIVQEALALARTADFYMISFGDCSMDSFIHRRGLLTKDEIEAVIRVGAVADTMGKFFDSDGRLVASDLNQRTPSISIEDMREHDLLLLAAGLGKRDALAAMLRSGTVDRLIVDGDLAAALLAYDALPSKL